MRLAIVAVVVAAAIGCKKKRDEPVPVVAPVKAEPESRLETPKQDPKPDPWLDRKPEEKPAQPAEPIAPSTPQPFDTDKLKVPAAGTPVEAMVQDARDVLHATAPELVLTKIVGSYLRKDGALDPTYGRLELELNVLDSVDGVVDDPNRPTGAPVPDVEPAEKAREHCPKLTFGGGGWISEERSCIKMKQLKGGPRCTVAQIWTKAIAQGAPDNAVAIVRFDARDANWTLQITDKIRKVNFYRSYADDCTVVAAPPSPKKPFVKPNPYDLMAPP